MSTPNADKKPSKPRFNTDFQVSYGVLETISPMVRRITANNPGPFTFKGTGTYVIGHGNVAVIDAGPALPEHVDALLAALSGETITHQLITHTHLDHSPASRMVKARTGAEIYGFGPHGSGHYEKGEKVEEGGDPDFVEDVTLRDGDIVEGDGWRVECLHTPGHTSNHLCFHLPEENALFSGDHVMGWSTTVISPPDGDMSEYLDSLERLSTRDEEIYYPTHGAPIDNPIRLVRGVMVHRRMRENQITTCLEDGVGRIAGMVERMYIGLDPRLIPAAQRSVFAHIIHMTELGKIGCDGEIRLDADYRLI